MTIQLYSGGMQVSFTAQPNTTNDGWISPAYLPNGEDDDMIYTDLVFPECVTYGTTTSPVYLTNKVEVSSGDEQRQQRWEYPRHEYSVNMENMNAAEISAILNLWHVCSGPGIGFLFLDPMDHTSANDETVFSGSGITAVDQPLVPVEGSDSEYELYKIYTKGNRTKRRRILYPKLDTLIVASAGSIITNWSYSYETNRLTIVGAPAPVTLICNKVGNVITTSGSFGDFAPGTLIFVDGFADASLNRPAGSSNGLRIVTANDQALELQEYDGTAWGGADEGPAVLTLGGGVAQAGSDLTAGFYFYVPVRFDEDNNAESEIKSGMRESAMADFNSIALREIRE